MIPKVIDIFYPYQNKRYFTTIITATTKTSMWFFPPLSVFLPFLSIPFACSLTWAFISFVKMNVVAQIPSLSLLGYMESGKFLSASDTQFTQLTENKVEAHVNDFLMCG